MDSTCPLSFDNSRLCKRPKANSEQKAEAKATRSQNPKAKSRKRKPKWCGPQVCQRGLVGQEDAMAHAQQTGHQVRIRNL